MNGINTTQRTVPGSPDTEKFFDNQLSSHQHDTADHRLPSTEIAQVCISQCHNSIVCMHVCATHSLAVPNGEISAQHTSVTIYQTPTYQTLHDHGG